MTLGKDFRLPTEVKPKTYDADLRLDLGAGQFEGRLDIALLLASPRREIVVHGVDLDVVTADAELPDGRRLAATVTADATSETISFAFPEILAAGAVRLALAYRGGFSPGLRGLYRAGPLAVTQFEAADARRLFPCFDEPAFKAVWKHRRLGRPRRRGGAVERRRHARRERRPRRTAHHLRADATAVVVPHRAHRRPDRAERGGPRPRRPDLYLDDGGEAPPHVVRPGDRGRAVLSRLEDYFGLPYPFGKLDQIGVPDFEAGAMENAGAITFREVALLADPATAPLAVQKRVAEVITHELAHQWFGNLVTMAWWDDLWLNEAFATWMAYKIVDDWRPSWRIWMDFEAGKGAALALDALVSAHPIRAEIKNAEEAGESFDAITYEKGGAVLRMLEGFLGADRFRDGIRLYMRRHREANATADNLWGALGEASGQPILEMANGWIRQTGYPLVSLSLTRGADGQTFVELAQRRFFAEPGAAARGSATRWLVPIVLRFRDAVGIKEQPVLLTESAARVPLPAEGEVAWCLGNAESRGFYRTAYSVEARARLLPAMGELRPAERVALLSDSWALVRAGEATIEGFLELVASLRAETDHVVLDELVGKLSIIEHRFVAEGDRESFGAFVADLFGAQAAALGWGPAPGAIEDDETRLRRAVLLRALVLLARAPAAVAEAQSRLPPTPLDPNLLDTVVTAAARVADEARFEDLRARARADADPAAKRRYLHALARVESPALAARAVELALAPDIPMQDFSSYVGVLLGNRATREAAFRLLRDRWTETRAKADSPMILRRLVESLATLPERRHFVEVQAFLEAHPIDGTKQATAQTLERMQMDADLRDRIIVPVGAWLRGRSARDPQAGMGRPGGLFVAAVTAAVVFFAGQQLFPLRPHEPPPPPVAPATPPAPPPAPPPPPAPAADAAARTDGPVAVAGDAAAHDAPAGVAPPAHDAPAGVAPPAHDAQAGKPDAPATADVAATPHVQRKPASVEEEKQSDKDLAREAWRRNLPDLSVDGPRAALLIPLKGSSQGATFHLTNKPRAVVIKLPQAASMITMRLYKIDREGFRLVRINQAEKDANPEDGSELKISLSDLGPPEVEIKDDFVRITVRRPSAPLPGAAASPPDAGSD